MKHSTITEGLRDIDGFGEIILPETRHVKSSRPPWPRGFAILATTIALAGCGATVTADQKATLTAAAVTLADVAVANNTTAATLVTKGGLFCAKATAGAPLVVALANLYGAPVSVVNQSADAVAAACALVGGVPVAPPADPAAAVVVKAPVAVLPAA